MGVPPRPRGGHQPDPLGPGAVRLTDRSCRLCGWIAGLSEVRTGIPVEIEATVDRVWAEVTDFAAHTEWMEDAHAIRFGTDQREGPGTVLLIDTRVGPFRTTDRFEITEIEPLLSVAGRHTGLFRGEGRFELSSPSPKRTSLVWRERIRFPWLLGGPAAALVGRVVLRRVWTRNLATLKRRIETGADPG
ncbi:MAG: hypothetical protein F4Y40_01400 [Acidimicrobiia bacterium]|nr:hypothetical protein [Acidimicrobiia bacterium]